MKYYKYKEIFFFLCVVTVVLSAGRYGLMAMSPNTDFLLNNENEKINKEEAEISALIKLLDVDDFETRDDAQKQLIDRGAKCLSALSEAYSESSTEVQARVRAIFKLLHLNQKIKDDVVKIIEQMINSKVLSYEQADEILEIYRIRSFEQFTQNLGSDRTLIIYEGAFTKNNSRKAGYNLKGIHNLSIVGEGKSPVKFLIRNGGDNVFTFSKCSNLSLINLDIGHSPKLESSCSGAVLSFYSCENILIEDSIMFGCGTIGFTLDNVKKFYVKNSTIKECTNYGAMSLFNCEDVIFEKLKIHDNITYRSHFKIMECSKVRFKYCEINNLEYHGYVANKKWPLSMFHISGESKDISFESGVINYHTHFKIVNVKDSMLFKNVEFKGYTFKIPQDVVKANDKLTKQVKAQSANKKGEK